MAAKQKSSSRLRVATECAAARARGVAVCWLVSVPDRPRACLVCVHAHRPGDVAPERQLVYGQGTHRALAAFEADPSLQWQLSMQEGAKVKLVTDHKDGWCEVELCGSLERGTVPLGYLEAL